MGQPKVLLFVFIIFLLELNGCGNVASNPSPDILGRWQVIGKHGLSVPHSLFWFSMDYIEFREDGAALGLMTWPPDSASDDIRLNKTGRYTLTGANQIEFVGSCRHQDPCTGVYTLTRTADTLKIADAGRALNLRWVGPPAQTLPLPAPGPAPSPTPAAMIETAPHFGNWIGSFMRNL